MEQTLKKLCKRDVNFLKLHEKGKFHGSLHNFVKL